MSRARFLQVRENLGKCLNFKKKTGIIRVTLYGQEKIVISSIIYVPSSGQLKIGTNINSKFFL